MMRRQGRQLPIGNRRHHPLTGDQNLQIRHAGPKRNALAK